MWREKEMLLLMAIVGLWMLLLGPSVRLYLTLKDKLGSGVRFHGSGASTGYRSVIRQS